MTVFDPTARLAPLTVSAALPDASVPVPSVVVPSEKVMVPVGRVDPEAAFTVAVRTVEAVCANVAGFAEITVVVAIAGIVTVTIVLPEDPLNEALPA